jgi:hypothetical protein
MEYIVRTLSSVPWFHWRQLRSSGVKYMGSLTLAAVLAAGMGAAAQADQVALDAPLDGTLYQADPPVNSNGIGSHFFVGVTNVGSKRRGLIKFDFSSIPPGSTITNVSLALSLNRSHGGSLAISMYRVIGAWGEGTSDAGNASDGPGVLATPGDVTWSHRNYDTTLWNTPGGDFEPSVRATTTVSGSNFYTWSGAGLVADVQYWLNNPSANNGWLMKGPETVTGAAKRFVSGDSTNTFQTPKLTVTFTPPPPCRADLDNGSGAGVRDYAVDVSDLIYFLVKFEAGVIAADLDNGSGSGTPDQAVDISDLLYFLVRFEAGC